MRQVDDDYREAEVRAYQSAGLGCLLAGVALLVTAGAVVWVVVWYFKQLIPLGGPLG